MRGGISAHIVLKLHEVEGRTITENLNESEVLTVFKNIIGKYLYKAGFKPEQVQRCKITMQEEYADMNGCLTDDGKIDWRPLCRECGIEYDPAEDYTDWYGWECVLSDRLSDFEDDTAGLKDFIGGYCGECTIEQAENLRKLIPQMWEEARKE